MISNNLKKRIITSIFLILLISLMFNSLWILSFVLIVIGNFSIIEFSNLINRINKKNLFKFLNNIFFIIYIFLFCFIFFILNNFIQTKIIVFTLLFCCVASDIGGYILGKTFNGPKLTKLSPNKTIIGSFGSILFSSLFLGTTFYFLIDKKSLEFFLIGLIVSIACQIGDIFFSFLKRKAKLKDTGKFLPGHGGFLDRIDSILIGIPVGLLMIIIFI